VTVIERARIIIGVVVFFAGCSANVQMVPMKLGRDPNPGKAQAIWVR
jgi:hypothetical protein